MFTLQFLYYGREYKKTFTVSKLISFLKNDLTEMGAIPQFVFDANGNLRFSRAKEIDTSRMITAIERSVSGYND